MFSFCSRRMEAGARDRRSRIAIVITALTNTSKGTVAIRSSDGRVFHVNGPQTLNARRPRTVLVRGTYNATVVSQPVLTPEQSGKLVQHCAVICTPRLLT